MNRSRIISIERESTVCLVIHGIQARI